MSTGSVLSVNNVTVVREGKAILGPLTWQAKAGERWVVLGPNGAGKSTLFNMLATQIHPTSGSVTVLDEVLGRVDVFELRPRIGAVSAKINELIPEDETVINLVITAAYAIVGRWQESYDLWDESRALSLLTILGVRELRDRIFSTLSDGEKKRVLIARALMPNPELLLLDEPAAGLDLGGREDLLQRLAALAADPLSPALVSITHHVEEIPAGTTHALLLREGKVIADGAVDEVITSAHLSTAYGLNISVTKDQDRFSAKATR